MALVRLIAETQCHRCLEVMPIGAPVVARAAVPALSILDVSYAVYHPQCLLDVEPIDLFASLDVKIRYNPVAALASVVGTVGTLSGDVAFEGREALAAAAAKRVQQRQRIEDEAKKRRARAVVEGGSAVRRRDEIALDRKGRPRVEVLWSVVGIDSLGSAAARDGVMHDQSFASSLREYVLIDAGKHAPLALPWQPMIGSLFVVSLASKLTRRAIERLVQWNAFDLGAPALWIIGASGAARDAVEQQLRGYLDEAGFAGDSARSLASERFDRESIAALGAMLDECFSIDAPAKRVIDAREQLLCALEKTVADERTAGYAGALTLVAKRLRGMSPEMKLRAAICAVACMRFEPARKAAIDLLAGQPHRTGVGALRAVLIDAMRSSRSVTSDHRRIWELLESWDDAGRFTALCDLLCEETKSSLRSKAWLEMLLPCELESVSEKLFEWARSRRDNDDRRERALAVAATINAAAQRAAEMTPLAKGKKRS